MHSFSDADRQSAVDSPGPDRTQPRAAREQRPDATARGRPGGAGPAPRVVFFATCLADRFFADACVDAVRVLRHFGVDVAVPAGQTCCGQPAYNIGRRDEAARMARHTDRVLAGTEHVVLPSGSCAGMMRSFYPELLGPADGRVAPTHGRVAPNHGRAEDGAAAASVSERTYELAEYLVRVLGVLESETPLGTGLAGRRVVYHHGCHALRELGVREEPIALLRACGAEVVPWDGDTECCGFWGLFSTKFPEVSAGMADRKLDALPPEIDSVTSADGGCLLQLSGRWTHRLRAGGEAGPAPVFVHLATLVREGVGS